MRKMIIGILASLVALFALFISLLLFGASAKATIGIMIAAVGVVGTYLILAIKWVPKPYEFVVEYNFPGKDTESDVWKPGLNFLWLPIKPIMYVRSRQFCADRTITMTIGVNDKNPGGPSLVEFKDASAGVIVQVIVRVIDSKKATYAVDNPEKATLNGIEARLRKALSALTLDEAMTQEKIRDEIARKIFRDINVAIEPWGMRLIGASDGKNSSDEKSSDCEEELSIIDFVLSPETIAQRQQILSATKAGEATKIKAKADKFAKMADGAAEAASITMRLKALGAGDAAKIEIISKRLGITKLQAMEYVLKLQLFEDLGKATLIATGNGAADMFTGMASILSKIQEATKEKTTSGEK